MKTNLGLVEHCKKALAERWGYVYGTYGKVLTMELFNQKLKQYPTNIEKYKDYILQHHINKRTTDCVGLIKSYIWWNGKDPVYSASTDLSANGMYEKAEIKDTNDCIPEIPGICVWRNGHIGVYIGNGQVIEAKGTLYGVIQSPLKGPGSNNWTHWLLCPYIQYEDVIPAYKAIIQKHVKLDAPELLWNLFDQHPYKNDLYRKLAKSYK